MVALTARILEVQVGLWIVCQEGLERLLVAQPADAPELQLQRAERGQGLAGLGGGGLGPLLGGLHQPLQQQHRLEVLVI